MEILSYSKSKIVEQIKGSKIAEVHESVKVIFSPSKIDDTNFNQACDVYQSLRDDSFDNVIIIEEHQESLTKKLSMSSHSYYKTPIGRVMVNDAMRNEFCDEEDDFFVDDAAYNSDMSLFHQLMLLQSVLDSFSVVSIAISNDERPSIIRELVYALDEILSLRNALVVVCCDLPANQISSFKKIMKYINKWEKSSFLNTILNDEIKVNGKSAFMTGILLSKEWNLKTVFMPVHNNSRTESLIAGYSYREYH